MTERAMLDVSMIAHPTPLARMRTLVKERPEALSGLVVSDAFLRLLEGFREGRDAEFMVQLIHRHFRVPRNSIDVDFMRVFVDSPAFRDQVGRYRRESSAETPRMYGALLDATGNEWVTQILYEEWEYLMNHSWLFSKTRAVYDHVVDAGANALYVTKQKLEKAIMATKDAAKEAGKAILEGSDVLVGKTIKKPADQKISPNDRVRALAKWVAVGGSAATSVMVPIAGVAIGVATGMFLLYDP